MSDNHPGAKPPQQPIQIQLDDQVAQGIYANIVILNHNENEFVLDFAFLPPLSPVAKVRSRVVASPKNAKRFLAALQKNLASYEERFGKIELVDEGPILH